MEQILKSFNLYFLSLSQLDKIIFIIFAVTLLIWLFQTIMIICGNDLHTDTDSDNSFGSSFNILSVTNIINFILGFTGFYLFIPFESIILSIISSILFGCNLVFCMSYILYLTSKLESAEYKYNYNDMVGLKGIVYTSIYKDNPGLIHVFYNGLTREIWAQTNLDTLYKVNEEVTIISMIDENTCVID